MKKENLLLFRSLSPSSWRYHPETYRYNLSPQESLYSQCEIIAHGVQNRYFPAPLGSFIDLLELAPIFVIFLEERGVNFVPARVWQIPFFALGYVYGFLLSGRTRFFRGSRSLKKGKAMRIFPRLEMNSRLFFHGIFLSVLCNTSQWEGERFYQNRRYLLIELCQKIPRGRYQ